MHRYTSAFAAFLALAVVSAPAMAKNRNAYLTVHAEQQSGSRDLRISGHGPASALVQVRVTGWISKDLPEIPLGDNNGYSQLITDASGNFSTTVSIATDNWENSMVRVEANTPGEDMHAVTDFTIQNINPHLNTEADRIPSH